MIDDASTATTNEICKLAAITKQHLGRLEANGIVHRSGRDQWPLVQTVNALFQQARQRSEAYSQAKARWEAARAQREELKTKKLAGELCHIRELNDAWTAIFGYMVAGIVAIPPRCTRDVALRRAIEKELDAWRADAADEFERRAAELSGDKGKAP
jgi:phage terminase Nu1 subunit (DNA packaging protein)